MHVVSHPQLSYLKVSISSGLTRFFRFFFHLFTSFYFIFFKLPFSFLPAKTPGRHHGIESVLFLYIYICIYISVSFVFDGGGGGYGLAERLDSVVMTFLFVIRKEVENREGRI